MQDNPELESDCLPRALLAAVSRDSHSNVCRLVALGATNVDEALMLAKMKGKHHAQAMLLLLIAAMNNDCNLVRRLFGEPVFNLDGEALSDEGFGEVQAVVKRGKVSTSVPIEIAHSRQHSSVIKELLLRTDVNQKGRTVDWCGLQLNVFDVNWLGKIHWVKRLSLACNRLKALPNEIGLCLQHVSSVVILFWANANMSNLALMQTCPTGVHGTNRTFNVLEGADEGEGKEAFCLKRKNSDQNHVGLD